MPIEFTHVPGKTHSADSTVPFFYDFAETATKLSLIEDIGFQKIVVDDPAGLLTNMDIAARALDRTCSLEAVLTHWAGVIEPTVAARQLAALDAKGGGRLSLRILSEPLNDDDAEARPVGHTIVWQRIDEYLVLLKRLWSNDRPFDHEGAFYSVRGGYVPRKGPQGAGMTIRMGGQSGTALRVAGRHADVFELAPGSRGEIRRLMERVPVPPPKRPGRQAAFRASRPDPFGGQRLLPEGARNCRTTGADRAVAACLCGPGNPGIHDRRYRQATRDRNGWPRGDRAAAEFADAPRGRCPSARGICVSRDPTCQLSAWQGYALCGRQPEAIGGAAHCRPFHISTMK
ncbi:LLM class flavin-dependent oxidoreductase [Mesorhizobium sp.]|uniref:LLM class flavin-dependent oxidoreductase n=1 Tax=Mesorhizobium sp. TaxID=1871066 RepID=UPI0025C44977|nr:LLM class flavin-dependent oxidoreductase [Mesorhizobium sp.]